GTRGVAGLVSAGKRPGSLLGGAPSAPVRRRPAPCSPVGAVFAGLGACRWGCSPVGGAAVPGFRRMDSLRPSGVPFGAWLPGCGAVRSPATARGPVGVAGGELTAPLPSPVWPGDEGGGSGGTTTSTPFVSLRSGGGGGGRRSGFSGAFFSGA